MKTQGNLSANDVKAYVLAGKATVTLESEITGAHFTYKVRAKEIDANKKLYFVHLLVNGDMYVYLGTFDGYRFKSTAKSRISQDAPSFKAFNYLVTNYITGFAPNENMHVFHNGCCARCGRELTDPESIRCGLGPVCRAM
jgi:hypothetical protein